MAVTTRQITPKRAGLKREICVMNTQGHGTLTTYDEEVEDSIEEASRTLEDFWQECIDEFNANKLPGQKVIEPRVFGHRTPNGEGELVNPLDDDFDLGTYCQVTIVPGPVVGG